VGGSAFARVRTSSPMSANTVPERACDSALQGRGKGWSMPLLASRGLLVWGLVLLSAVTAVQPSFAEDPSTADCVAASADWIKLRKEQRLLDARSCLITCAAPSCPAEVREECSRHLPEVNAAMPSIVFVARDIAGNDLTAVVVTMDGQPLADKLDGRAIAIDPGEHTFRFASAGLQPLEKKLVIYEGDKERREAIEIGVKATPPAAPILPRGSPIEPAQLPSTPTREAARSAVGTRSGLKGQRLVAVVIGGVGVAGLAGGSVGGLIALSGWSSAQQICPKGQSCSDSSAQTKRRDALTAATVSDVCFIAGGALLAGGFSLFLTARSGSSTHGAWEVTPAVGSSATGVLLRGDF
jgi:hypothetical protein